MVKYWDGDKFEEILELSGHHEEVWALTVANKGHFVVSAGNDRSLRLWVQTDQQVFLDEERERKMAESYDNSVRLAGDVASSSAIGAVVGGIAKGKHYVSQTIAHSPFDVIFSFVSVHTPNAFSFPHPFFCSVM